VQLILVGMEGSAEIASGQIVPARMRKPMNRYTQLTREQRYQIQECIRWKYKLKLSTIAARVGVSVSTISRELKRNATNGRGYRAEAANNKALARRMNKVRPRITQAQWSQIELQLRNDWSPEQIMLWGRKNGQLSVSHERIYQYILEDKMAGGDLFKHLRGSKKRRNRYGSYKKRNPVAERVFIDERAPAVEKRLIRGHWEVDLIMGKRQRCPMVTLTERKSRFCLIGQVDSKNATSVMQRVIELLLPFKTLVRTITSDNGKEFAYHKKIAEQLDAKFYFAHPYHSWERGTNENTNGLLRQYLPKTMDFRSITQDQLDHAMNRLNHRPKKCLKMKTPSEVFFNSNQRVALTN